MAAHPNAPLALEEVINRVTAVVRDAAVSHAAKLVEAGEERFGSFVWQVDVSPKADSAIFQHRYLFVGLTPQANGSADPILAYRVGITIGADNSNAYIRENACALVLNVASLDSKMEELREKLRLELAALTRKSDQELMIDHDPEAYVVPRTSKDV